MYAYRAALITINGYPLAVPGISDCRLLLSVAVMLFGDEYNGSKRWLSLGPVSFQPSEFAKVAVILFLAWLVEKNVRKMGKVQESCPYDAAGSSRSWDW